MEKIEKIPKRIVDFEKGKEVDSFDLPNIAGGAIFVVDGVDGTYKVGGQVENDGRLPYKEVVKEGVNWVEVDGGKTGSLGSEDKVKLEDVEIL